MIDRHTRHGSYPYRHATLSVLGEGQGRIRETRGSPLFLERARAGEGSSRNALFRAVEFSE